MIRYLVFIFLFLQGCTAASGDIFIILKDQILGYSEPVIELADIEKSNTLIFSSKARTIVVLPAPEGAENIMHLPFVILKRIENLFFNLF